jgi:hypothetical protein
VLDDHLLDGGFGEIGIERGAAEAEEVVEGGDEFFITGLAFLDDELAEAGADFGDAFLEFIDGFFPFGDGGRGVAEEEIENVDEVFGLFEIGFVEAFALLVEDGAGGFLEEDVVLRITSAASLASQRPWLRLKSSRSAPSALSGLRPLRLMAYSGTSFQSNWRAQVSRSSWKAERTADSCLMPSCSNFLSDS